MKDRNVELYREMFPSLMAQFENMNTEFKLGALEIVRVDAWRVIRWANWRGDKEAEYCVAVRFMDKYQAYMAGMEWESAFGYATMVLHLFGREGVDYAKNAQSQ